MKIVDNVKKASLRELSNLILTSPKIRHLILPEVDKKIKAFFSEMLKKQPELDIYF